MYSTGVNCSDLELNMDDFHNNKESITFHQWIRVDNKIQKSEIELPCDEICQKFNNDLKVLKKHVKRQQHACCNKLKEELGEARFYCLLIIVKTIATFSKMKFSALTLVTTLFDFHSLLLSP